MRRRFSNEEAVIRSDEKKEGGFSCFYELIMRKSHNVSSYRIPLYSMRVKLIDGEGEESQAEIKDAFADIGKAVTFYEKLVRNFATPIDLAYILEDEIIK